VCVIAAPAQVTAYLLSYTRAHTDANVCSHYICIIMQS